MSETITILGPTQSFGEEILFNLNGKYDYTAKISSEKVTLLEIN
jgi:hypothetical protein